MHTLSCSKIPWGRRATEQSLRHRTSLFRHLKPTHCFLNHKQSHYCEAVLHVIQPSDYAPFSLSYAYKYVLLMLYSSENQGEASQLVSGKNRPASAGAERSILGWEDPLEKGMATHSRILACRIPCTEEPGWLQSMGSQKSLTRLSNGTTTKARDRELHLNFPESAKI